MTCAALQTPSLAVPLEQWINESGARFETAAQRALPSVEEVPERLHQAMRYAVLDGGKRVRPLLVYAAGEVTAAECDALDRAALAVEFVHAYSLVHDDMPCMDNDVLRRGKATVHVEFDEATACWPATHCSRKLLRCSPTRAAARKPRRCSRAAHAS